MDADPFFSIKASMWFHIAANNGNPDGTEGLKLSDAELNSNQRKQALDMATRWVAPARAN